MKSTIEALKEIVDANASLQGVLEVKRSEIAQIEQQSEQLSEAEARIRDAITILEALDPIPDAVTDFDATIIDSPPGK